MLAQHWQGYSFPSCLNSSSLCGSGPRPGLHMERRSLWTGSHWGKCPPGSTFLTCVSWSTCIRDVIIVSFICCDLFCAQDIYFLCRSSWEIFSIFFWLKGFLGDLSWSGSSPLRILFYINKIWLIWGTESLRVQKSFSLTIFPSHLISLFIQIHLTTPKLLFKRRHFFWKSVLSDRYGWFCFFC